MTDDAASVSESTGYIGSTPKTAAELSIVTSPEALQPAAAALPTSPNLGTRASPVALTTSSPNVITHRRQRSISSRKKKSSGSSARSVSDTVVDSTPTTPVTSSASASGVNLSNTVNLVTPVVSGAGIDYDRSRFQEETYINTPYHFASEIRNEQFHALFPGLPKSERLLDDFSCSLSREFLYQGRLYVSQKYLSFSSNILGWISKIQVPFREITYMEKTSAVGLFPNAIAVETAETDKTQFNGFASRDATFEMIKDIWSQNLIADPLDSSSGDDLGEQVVNTETSILKGYRLKESSSFLFNGSALAPAHYAFDVPKLANPNEHLLVDEVLPSPPGLVFELLFGNGSTFLEDWLKAQGAWNVSKLNGFEEIEITDKTCVFQGKRHYEYEKPLHNAMGPRSTFCEATEIVWKRREEDVVPLEVVSTTYTPRVPSGSHFLTHTRVTLQWASATETRIRVSYWLVWTGGSWIKALIEAGARTGQAEATGDFMKLARQYIERNTEPYTVECEGIAQPSSAGVAEEIANSNHASAGPTALAGSTVSTAFSCLSFFRIDLSARDVIALVFFVLIAVSQWRISVQQRELRLLLTEGLALSHA